MSHELRTPLNAILGYSELLEFDLHSTGNQEQLDDVGKIHTAGNHLLSIINAVLDLSKVDAGKMEVIPNEFLVSDLLDEIVTISVPLMLRNQNNLEVQCSDRNLCMHTDIQKLKQVLLNLLSNAAKFSKHCDITLTVKMGKGSTDDVQFSVSDQGIGIPADKLPALFKPFTQVDGSSTREFEGTGLGLYLTKRFVEILGGAIAVDSREGVGSTFTVSVPKSLHSI